MNNQTQSCLSEETFGQIGRGEVLPHDLAAIEQHVTDCHDCREKFDSAYAAAQWSDFIFPALSQSVELPTSGDEYDRTSSEQAMLVLLGPTDNPNMLGRIGTYEINGVIGRGGMGIVFKAYDGALDRFVAIKMLSPHLSMSGAARKRFVREGKAAAAVIDDHVLPVYGVDQWRDTPYLVTQYSRGESLQQRLRREGPLELIEILRISLHTAKGLAAAHAQGLVHRDVKPSNILLSETIERAMLSDFGLARAVDDASMTRSGMLAGTPQYMSPEQVRGEKVDQRSDLFSLGSVMYAMCTGHPPFRAESSYSMMRLIADRNPRPIQEINPDIPDWVCNIIGRLMSKNKVDRFQSASEAAELIEACLSHVQQPTEVSLPCRLADEESNSLPSSATKGLMASSTSSRIRPPYKKLLIALGFAIPLLLAGILIKIETSKGTITIGGGAEDRTFVSKRNGRVKDKLTVGRDQKAARRDDQAPEEAHRKLMDSLQGEWLVTFILDDEGHGLDEFEERHATISIDDKLLTVRGKIQGHSIEIPMALKLVGAETPQAVDILNDPNDTERPCLQLGIIECENDRMRFCCTCKCNPPKSSRPKFFSAGAKTWLFEARRMRLENGSSPAASRSSLP